jgi:iron-sulfur cluster assembly protein
MIRLTDSAVRRVKHYIEQQNDTSGAAHRGLRFGVRGGGCSGFEYVMEPAAGPSGQDHVFEFDGLEVYVDPRSLPFVDGTEIDFGEGIQDHGFQFRNPQALSRCGCGTSFAVER